MKKQQHHKEYEERHIGDHNKNITYTCWHWNEEAKKTLPKADELVNAEKYERSGKYKGYRSGHLQPKLSNHIRRGNLKNDEVTQNHCF
ncbi:hypothetical protein CLNEO_24210 [Anaerotignum neopropionicum]|uniref:Uncharacterized protein n=1 Tax=Anaerotignum neopropionicum TaxID=36847 RepID=A0A136WCS8_9FIRM|nr:hypothetical protein [Anaerotignum neopropionicum]KXL52256.1 hypothetical protein CLNEO_24210 [Anaerotignum neopropionicum]